MELSYIGINPLGELITLKHKKVIHITIPRYNMIKSILFVNPNGELIYINSKIIGVLEVFGTQSFILEW